MVAAGAKGCSLVQDQLDRMISDIMSIQLEGMIQVISSEGQLSLILADSFNKKVGEMKLEFNNGLNSILAV